MLLPPPRPGVRPQLFNGSSDAAEWILAEQYLLPELVRSIENHAQDETPDRRLTSALEMCFQPTNP